MRNLEFLRVFLSSTLDYGGGLLRVQVLGQLLSRVLANFPFSMGMSFVQLNHQMSCASNVCRSIGRSFAA